MGLMELVVLAVVCFWLLLAAVKNPRRSEERSRGCNHVVEHTDRYKYR